MYVIDGIVFEQYYQEYNLTHNNIFNFNPQSWETTLDYFLKGIIYEDIC